jgi:hypothetical protein
VGARAGGRSLIAGLALLAAVTVAGCASHAHAAAGGARPRPSSSPSASPSSSAAAGTTVRTFAPYAVTGRLVVPPADAMRGNCWTTSIAAPDPHAYRCFAGNAILDPCFAPPTPPHPSEVACFAAPWSAPQTLRLTAPLPTGPPVGNPSRPWAFEAQGGVRCVATTGTVPQVAGVDLGYHCTDGRDAALVDTGAPQWSAEVGAPGATTLVRLPVRTIWRG